MSNISNRIKVLFENTNADVIFLMNTDQEDSNFLYLTEFTSGVFEQNVLIVTKKGLILPVSILEYEIAKEQRPKEMKVIKVDSRKKMDAIIKKYTKSKIVGINGSFLPYRYYQMLKKRGKPKKIVDVSKAFYVARSIKDKTELDKMRKSNRIAKSAFEETKKFLKVGMTEKEVAAMLEYQMMKRGANGVAFKSIVSFNANAALPHHMPDDTKLTPNSIVLIDWGAKYNNYCSDLTRTFVFKPNIKSDRYKRFTEMHKIVLEAQKIGFKLIKNGDSGSKAHNAAAEHINKASNGKYKGKFIHSLGHAIGLEVHDWGPGLYPNTEEKLKEGMVVSDEPGIYIVGFGGVRIEDDVLVTKKGPVML